jgi:RsiW-degrading membrane proteinase PrsW (M82 family)
MPVEMHDRRINIQPRRFHREYHWIRDRQTPESRANVARKDPNMMEAFLIALVCAAALAAAAWFVAAARRGGPVDDVVGSAVVTTLFAGSILITLGVTDGVVFAAAIAAAVLLAVGAQLRRTWAC